MFNNNVKVSRGKHGSKYRFLIVLCEKKERME